VRRAPEFIRNGVEIEINQTENAVIDKNHMNPRPETPPQRVERLVPAGDAPAAAAISRFGRGELHSERRKPAKRGRKEA
jgi:hypothetical protein